MNKKANAAAVLAVVLVAAVGLFVIFSNSTNSTNATGNVLKPIIITDSSASCGRYCLSNSQCAGRCGLCLANRCTNPSSLRPVKRDAYTQCYIDCAKENNRCREMARSQSGLDACARALYECNQGCLQYA